MAICKVFLTWLGLVGCNKKSIQVWRLFCAVLSWHDWHPIEACLWGLTRRRINRFKYGRFSIFHQGFSSEMSFTANYAHGRVQSQSSSIGITDWSRFYDDETHGFNSVSRHISRKINLVLESLRLLALQSSINFCAITQLFRWCRKVSQKLIASASRRWFFSVFCYSQSQLVW